MKKEKKQNKNVGKYLFLFVLRDFQIWRLIIKNIFLFCVFFLNKKFFTHPLFCPIIPTTRVSSLVMFQ